MEFNLFKKSILKLLFIYFLFYETQYYVPEGTNLFQCEVTFLSNLKL